MIKIGRLKRDHGCSACHCTDETETRYYSIRFGNITVSVCDECIQELDEAIEMLLSVVHTEGKQ